MGVLFSALWRLDTTAACVAVFVVALGSLWLYVTLARPAHSSREYERLEELLGDGSTAAVTAGAGGGGGGGKKEGKKRRGRGKTVSSFYALFTSLTRARGVAAR